MAVAKAVTDSTELSSLPKLVAVGKLVAAECPQLVAALPEVANGTGTGTGDSFFFLNGDLNGIVKLDMNPPLADSF